MPSVLKIIRDFSLFLICYETFDKMNKLNLNLIYKISFNFSIFHN